MGMNEVNDVTTAVLPLRGGGSIPVVGLGVYQTARGATTRNTVTTALRLGYRHIDTARLYGNEADVGAAVRASDIPREQVFVTTKLWNSAQGHDSALAAFDASCERLGLDYVSCSPFRVPTARLSAAQAVWGEAEAGSK